MRAKKKQERKKMRAYTYEARVIGDKRQRFPLQSPRPLQSGDDVTRDDRRYRVAYVTTQNGNTLAILSPVARRGRPKKAKG